MEPLKELFLKLGLDWQGSSFASAQVAVDALEFAAKKLVAAFDAVGRYTVQAVLHTAELADKLDETSRKTAVSTDALQEFAYGAGLSGISAEGLNTALVKLSVNMTKALEGSAEAGAAFARAGIRLRDSSGNVRSTEEVFLDVAEALKGMPDDARRAGLAVDLFGRSGAELLPYLLEGRAGIERLRKEARDLGVVMDADLVGAGARLQDNLDRLRAAWASLAHDLGGPIIEALEPLVQELVEWVKANRELIKTKIHGFAATFGKLVVGLLRGVGKLVKGLELLGAALKTVAIVIGSYLVAKFVLLNALLLEQLVAFALNTAAAVAYGAVMVATGIKAAVAWLAAAAPVALVTALLALMALAAEDVYRFLTGGDSVIGELGPKWTKFLDSVTTVKPGDPVWLVWLKKALEVIFDLQGAWTKIVGMFNRDELFVNFVRGVASMTGITKSSIEEITPEQSQAYGPSVAFGGGASPTATAAASPGAAQPRIFAPRMNAPITVTGAPGQNPEEVAGAVREQLEDFWDSKMRDGAASIPGWGEG